VVDYVIVQAGGKGSRLEHLTANKPKALVPVDNLPMIFHLFRHFPDKKFIVIADTHREVMREYLECFADVTYEVVDASGTGTCSGVAQALRYVPAGEPFALVWSDLILPDGFDFPDDGRNYIGISQTFPCRWSYRDHQFIEAPSTEFGVAGLFVFAEKAVLHDVPESGELVRWLSTRGLDFQPLGLAGTREFGILAEYEKLEAVKSRPFNKITVSDGKVIKEAVDAQGEDLAVKESRWYQYASEHGVTAIPKIESLNPLTMDLVTGSHLYDLGDLPITDKREILQRVCQALQQLHGTGSAPTDPFSIREAYYTKTINRLMKVRDLIPHADQKWIYVNGKRCRNIFFFKREFERALAEIEVPEFKFIHGDNTFSNIIYEHKPDAPWTEGKPVFIDPRGYFGDTLLFGDPAYDWAKLYYSVVGNYDQFNLKRFRLEITSNGANLDIVSSGWENLADELIELSGVPEKTIKLIHAVIWLSLTTYAWQDYDSICGAFYNGLYYLQEVM